MNTLEDSTDRWVLRCNNFETAARYAAEKNWALREWSWFPACTLSNNIQVFRRAAEDK